MKLKDLSSVFGWPVEDLKKQSRRATTFMMLLYLADIAFILGATVFMFYNGSDAQWYGVALAFICIVANFVILAVIGVDKQELYRFYKRHKTSLVYGKCYDMDKQKMQSLLEWLGVQIDANVFSMIELKEQLLKEVKLKLSNAEKLGKHLAKYETESSDFKCFVLEKGKKVYFIGFIEDYVKPVESVEESTENSEEV